MKQGNWWWMLALGALVVGGCDDKGDKTNGDGDDSSEKAEKKKEDPSITITASKGKLKDFKLKSKHAKLSTLTGTAMKKDKKTFYYPVARVYLSDGEKLIKGAPADDKVMLYLSLKGKETAEKSKDPLPKGEYKDGTGDMTVSIQVTPKKADGTRFDVRQFKGGVTITKSKEKKLEGTIDVTKDGVSIKGPFTVTM